MLGRIFPKIQICVIILSKCKSSSDAIYLGAEDVSQQLHNHFKYTQQSTAQLVMPARTFFSLFFGEGGLICEISIPHPAVPPVRDPTGCALLEEQKKKRKKALNLAVLQPILKKKPQKNQNEIHFLDLPHHTEGSP